MMSRIFHGNAALFPLPPLVHCQIAVAYLRHTTDAMVSVMSSHVKGHVDGSALLRRAASGLDVGHPSQWRCRRRSGRASDFCAYYLWIIGLCWVYH